MASIYPTAKTSEEPVRLVVTGTGVIGQEHLRRIAVSKSAVLVGVADPSEVSRMIAEEYGVPHFTNHAVMLDSLQPDGAILAVPNKLHKEATLACIERGVPSLIEKPIADDLLSAATIVAASESADVPALIGHHRRHSPTIRAARAAVRSGRLGRVVAANGMWLARKPDDYFDIAWRREPGGGPFLINLIHELDCLRYIVGDIDTVFAVSSNATRGFEIEDTGALVCTFQNGAVGSFVLSDVVPSPWLWDVASGEGASFPLTAGDSFYFGGTNGSLAIPSMSLNWHAPGEDWRNPLLSTTLQAKGPNPYAAQLDHFVDVVRGAALPVCNPRDAFITLAATLAAVKSAQRGQPVSVSELTSEAWDHSDLEASR